MLATVRHVFFQCNATTADTEMRARLGRHVHPHATDAEASIYHSSCQDATLRQALRERGWDFAGYLVVGSADGCVCCAQAVWFGRA